MLTSLLNMLWFLVKWPIYILFGIVLLFYVVVTVHILFQFVVKKRRFKKPEFNHRFKRHPVKDVVWNFPKQIALDFYDRNPDAFPYKGVIIFEGPQGAGKSCAMMEFATFMKKQYPGAKIACNIDYSLKDANLTDWKMLLTYVNGELGVIDIIDELQNWFNSKDSKDFPPDMLNFITQMRKNRRIVLGTAQSFYMISKDIRTQTSEVRTCRTFMNCLTFVIRRVPHIDSAGEVVRWSFKGIYFFAHTPELRNCYDTYEIVNRVVKVGYNERPVDVKVDMSQFR